MEHLLAFLDDVLVFGGEAEVGIWILKVEPGVVFG